IAECRPFTREEIVAATDCPLARELLSENERAGLRDACVSAVLGVGDCIVSDTSASLAGVGDEGRVPANHRAGVRRGPGQAAGLSFLGRPMGEPPAIAVILDRLSDEPSDADVPR